MITQFFGKTIIKKLNRLSATTAQLPAGSNIRIGGQGAILDSALNLDVTGTGLGGLDSGSIAANSLYYVYVVISGSTLSLVASLSASAPTGFLIYRKIGAIYTNPSAEITIAVEFGKTTTDWSIPEVHEIDADTTAPTKATVVERDEVRFRAVDGDYECNYLYRQDANTGAAVGSGEYIYSFPSGIKLDTTFLTPLIVPSLIAGNDVENQQAKIGIGHMGAGASKGPCNIFAASQTTFKLISPIVYSAYTVQRDNLYSLLNDIGWRFDLKFKGTEGLAALDWSL